MKQHANLLHNIKHGILEIRQYMPHFDVRLEEDF